MPAIILVIGRRARHANALAVLAGASISPQVAIHTCRQYIYALRAGSRRVEISLDEDAIMASGRAIGFRELEVELLADGSDADLDALIDCLHSRFPLTPEPRGKRARDMAFLDRAFGGLATAAHVAPVVTAGEEERAFAVGAR